MPEDPRLGTELEVSLARDMYRVWVQGMPKSVVEERYLGTDKAHGKRFSNLVKKHLDIDTEREHPLAAENARLRALLRKHGINPDSEA